jgi:hypothetical protein
LLNKLLSHAPMQKSCKGNIVMLSCSKVPVSIAYFAWGERLPLFDNLFTEAFLKRKEKYIFFFLSFL